MTGLRAALLALSLAFPSAAGEAFTATFRSISLPEAYALAFKRSEQLAERRESVAQALARVDELKAAVMPHLSLAGSELLQESPNIGSSPVNQTSVPLLQLTAVQPLFSGFREFLAFKAGKKQAESISFDERRARSLLCQDVAQAYLDLLRARKEIDIRRAIIEAAAERIRQLERWIKIGRSRESEALAARAQLAQYEAQAEIARGQERVSQEALGFLTGLDMEGFVELSPEDVPAPAPEPIAAFLDRAKRRSDVVAREADAQAARLNAEIVRRQRWPTLGLTGDYYLKRSGFTQNVHYDALLALSLPLWDAGAIGAQTREAEALERSGAEALSLAQRSAQRDVRSAYRSLEWTSAAERALDAAAELAQANVKAQAEDYKKALVTNIEVLDSLNTLSAARIALNQMRLQAALARIQLEVAAGGPEPAGGKP